MQRWEREQGLPVHRLPHNRMASVYAFAHEIDAWWEQRRLLLVDQADPLPDVDAQPATEPEAPTVPPAHPVQEAEIGPVVPAAAAAPDVPAAAASSAPTGPRVRVWRSYRLIAASAVAIVVLGLLAGWSSRHATAEIASVAVVPLASSGSSDAPIVAASVSEEIVRHLARIRNVRVMGGASNARAAGAGRSVVDMAAALGADAVLTGRLDTHGDQVDVEVQLTRARTGEVVWNGHYGGPVQATDTSRGAAPTLVAQLSGKLWPREKVPDAPARVHEAYLAYMRGRYQLAKRERNALLAAEAEFNLALEKDPRFSDAAAGLADTLILMGVFGVRDHAQSYAAAKVAARDALSYDPENAEAYTALAFATEMFDHDWAQAEAYFQRAIVLDPSSAGAHHWYALLLDSSLRGDEAIREIETARALEPLSPNINSDAGMILAHQGHAKEAIAQFTRTLAMDPTYVDAYAELGYAYREAGDYEKAIQSFQRARELGADPLEVHFNLVICEVRRGNLARARQMVAELQQPGELPGPPTDIQLARELVAIGDYDRGLDILLRHPEYGDVNWLVGSIYRPLWTDARFHQLLRRVGLLETLYNRGLGHVSTG